MLDFYETTIEGNNLIVRKSDNTIFRMDDWSVRPEWMKRGIIKAIDCGKETYGDFQLVLLQTGEMNQ